MKPAKLAQKSKNIDLSTVSNFFIFNYLYKSSFGIKIKSFVLYVNKGIL